MTVELNELQDAARKVMEGAGVAVPENESWQQIIELGWLLVSVPESLGGLETGVQGFCTMQMELGRGLCAAAYLPAMLAVDAVCQSAISDRDTWLERLMGGELVTASLANGDLQTDGKNLNGTISGVQSANTASHVLVWSAGREVVALVATQQPGVELITRSTWDQTRRLFDVRIQNVELSRQTILAEGAAAADLIRRLLSLRDFAFAADAIGGAGALLNLTIEHLQTRIQFKRPLAMFQALKHRCADMKASIAAAEALLFDALRMAEVDINNQHVQTRATGAKLLATNTFARVAEDCLQLHGGIGMADEHPCHLFLKRALLSEQLGDSPGRCAQAVASVLVANV